MVFGWGKKKDENKKFQEFSTPSQQISLSDVAEVLLKHKQAKQSQVLRDTKPRFETIKAELRSISAIIEHLENDDLKLDDVDTRLKVIVSRGKTEVVRIISSEAKTQISKIESYGAVIKHAEILSHTLKKIGDVLGRNTRVIHIFAKKYANDLKMHLETITANHAEILKMIKEVSEFESTESIINDKKGKYRTTIEEISKNTSRLAKAKDSVQKHVQRIAELEQKIQARQASPEYGQFLQSKQHLKQLLDEETRFDKEVDDEFSKISRPLGKYFYVTSLDKPLKSMLEQLTQNPSKALTKENKNHIVTILESCMKGVMSGTVSIKGNEKTVDHITGLISMLDTLIDRKHQHRLKIAQVKEKIGFFDSDGLADLEKELETAVADKEHTESKIKSLESDLEQQKKDSQYLLEHVADLLQTAVGTKYVVVG